MCIIIYKPKGKMIPKEYLAASWNANRDGGGFMYAKEGHIRITKALDSFAVWYSLYEKVNPVKHEMVVHFRIGTSGLMNLENCHPFSVNNSLAFCHNGIMPFNVPKDSPVSDTVLFGRNILQRLPADFHKNRGILDLLSRYIGNGKVVLLDKRSNVVIVNEDKGHWLNDCWYSNHSYEWRPVTVSPLLTYGMPLNANHSGILPGIKEEEEDEDDDFDTKGYRKPPWWKR